MKYVDSHLHLSNIQNIPTDFLGELEFCTSCHSLEEISKCKEKAFKNVYYSFGIHPQNLDISLLNDLEFLLKNKDYSIYPEIDAIGEMGFDLFTEEYKNTLTKQIEIWNYQLELADKYSKPIIIHCRKALNYIFSDAKKLKKIRGVIFHSFPGSVTEAISFRKQNINSFYSFGKSILNNRKNSISCVKELPMEWLLFETDAPYQLLKNETETSMLDIKKIFQKGSEIRNCNQDYLLNQIYTNYHMLFSSK